MADQNPQAVQAPVQAPASIHSVLTTLQDGVHAVNLHVDTEPDGARKIGISKDLNFKFGTNEIEKAGLFVVLKTTGMLEMAMEGVEALGVGNSPASSKSPAP